jgi:hypothetical protein
MGEVSDIETSQAESAGDVTTNCSNSEYRVRTDTIRNPRGAVADLHPSTPSGTPVPPTPIRRICVAPYRNMSGESKLPCDVRKIKFRLFTDQLSRTFSWPIYAYGTAELFLKRSHRYTRLLRWLSFWGLVLPVFIGGVVTGFGSTSAVVPWRDTKS